MLISEMPVRYHTKWILIHNLTFMYSNEVFFIGKKKLKFSKIVLVSNKLELGACSECQGLGLQLLVRSIVSPRIRYEVVLVKGSFC